ncbi:MAG: hypothetical protein PHR30_16550 [Gallionellaceae bacterium]|nr:hypothetical protein [Gallionellaceae bacterium]
MIRYRVPVLGTIVLILGALLLARPAQAQTIVNPTQVTFESPDHALAIGYDLGYYLSGAASPVQTVRVPVASVTGEGTYSILLSKPLLGQNLILKARTVATASGGGEITSEWSEPSNAFTFAPVVPRALVVK